MEVEFRSLEQDEKRRGAVWIHTGVLTHIVVLTVKSQKPLINTFPSPDSSLIAVN